MKKRYYHYILSGIIFGIIIGVSFSSITQSNQICINNQYGEICVYPKIDRSATIHKQFFNLTVYGDYDIDVAFVFNETQKPINGGIFYKNNTGKYIKLNHNYYNFNGRHAYIFSVSLNAYQLYQGYYTYTQPINTTGKWDMYVKLQTDTWLEYRIHLDPWWNSSYPYKKGTCITNNETDYAMRVIVGNSSGGNVNLNSHLGYSDFRDIVFVGSDNTTQLWFWMQNYTADTVAYFYVNVSNFDYINMYYGRDTGLSGYDTYMNGTNTFDIFDDFESYNIDDVPSTNGWYLYWGGTNNYINISANPSGSGKVLEIYYDNNPQTSAYQNFSLYDDLRQNMKIYFTALNDYNYPHYFYESGSTRFSSATYVLDFDTDDLNYWTGSEYADFTPDLDGIVVDTWYRWLSYVATSGVDDWDILVNDTTSHDGGARSVVTNGIDQLRIIRGVDQKSIYIDDFWIDDYVIPEPSFCAWGVEQEYPVCRCLITNPSPSNNSIGISSALVNFTVLVNASLGCTIEYVNISMLNASHNVTSVSNGTFYLNISAYFTLNSSTTYTWYVNTSCDNRTNNTYFMFTTSELCPTNCELYALLISNQVKLNTLLERTNPQGENYMLSEISISLTPMLVLIFLFSLFWYTANKHEDIVLMLLASVMLFGIGLYYISSWETINIIFGSSVLIGAVYGMMLALSFSARAKKGNRGK